MIVILICYKNLLIIGILASVALEYLADTKANSNREP